MTAYQRDRWAIPSLRREAVARAMLAPGKTQRDAANDSPSWASVSVTWDVDAALLIEVTSRRPDQDVGDVMLHLADQLSGLGWTQEAAGTMRYGRPDGVGCPAAWSTWRKVTA